VGGEGAAVAGRVVTVAAMVVAMVVAKVVAMVVAMVVLGIGDTMPTAAACRWRILTQP